eukprot:TRINITY_DN111976_c0_g1_i1.p1 TRINITY_DN111976_c0_g1~~TRINITY_DN111976_c0_g1_i1.p1  ORF type:complete len:311 (-),score=49.38 TRINITY_DN111976_c0_g1_i1:119-1015(-)
MADCKKSLDSFTALAGIIFYVGTALYGLISGFVYFPKIWQQEKLHILHDVAKVALLTQQCIGPAIREARALMQTQRPGRSESTSAADEENCCHYIVSSHKACIKKVLHILHYVLIGGFVAFLWGPKEEEDIDRILGPVLGVTGVVIALLRTVLLVVPWGLFSSSDEAREETLRDSLRANGASSSNLDAEQAAQPTSAAAASGRNGDWQAYVEQQAHRRATVAGTGGEHHGVSINLPARSSLPSPSNPFDDHSQSKPQAATEIRPVSKQISGLSPNVRMWNPSEQVQRADSSSSNPFES